MTWAFLSEAFPNTQNAASVSGFTLFVSLLPDLFTHFSFWFCNNHKHWLFTIDFSQDEIPRITDNYL